MTFSKFLYTCSKYYFEFKTNFEEIFPTKYNICVKFIYTIIIESSFTIQLYTIVTSKQIYVL